jgi:predicted RNA binding protein YcfA (HicA-like mRNA interferase family)
MPKLPVMSGDQCRKALERYGYVKDHQTGSHMKMVKPGNLPITVPRHDELDTGTLRAIIRDANLTVTQFIRLLKK